MQQPDIFLPHRITFQWHITDRCNYRCAHCYQKDYTDGGRTLPEMIHILDQFTEFAQRIPKTSHRHNAHINFTGGEPFSRPDFLELLAETAARKCFSFGILSNGLLMPAPELLVLQKLKPSFIQISLEGDRATNDSIRGAGSYDDITHSMRVYEKLGIPVVVSFTANAKNYLEFPKVVKIAKELKATKVWTDRYLPMGAGDLLSLNTPQTREYFADLHAQTNTLWYKKHSKTVVSSNRALQFLAAGGQPYRCSAGETLLAILPNGDVLPCRRLPIVVGNMFGENLWDLYQTHATLLELRKPDATDEACATCYYKRTCKGGLKCLAFAQTGDFTARDPNCWL
jgi:radical SAM protein with 4Fe4S-binding SPASM domain